MLGNRTRLVALRRCELLKRSSLVLRCSLSTSRTRNPTTGNNNNNKKDRQEEQNLTFLKKGFQPTGFTRDGTYVVTSDLFFNTITAFFQYTHYLSMIYYYFGNNFNMSSSLHPTSLLSQVGVYMGSTFFTLSPHTLPELDVSPFLDTKHYGRIAGHSINGNDAAIRLTQAKRKLRRLVHDELHGKNDMSGFGGSTTTTANTKSRERRLYILRHHGVPPQLLQHLVTVADKWLQQKAALELRVDHAEQNSLSVVTSEGASWQTLWPTSTEWNYGFSLYQACMARMVQSLGTMAPMYDAYELPENWTWKANISRRDKLPVTLFPTGTEVLPVIEWEIPEKDSRERKVMIRLQGSVDPKQERHLQNLKKSHDVSLIFEATFDAANVTTETVDEE